MSGPPGPAPVSEPRWRRPPDRPRSAFYWVGGRLLREQDGYRRHQLANSAAKLIFPVCSWALCGGLSPPSVMYIWLPRTAVSVGESRPSVTVAAIFVRPAGETAATSFAELSATNATSEWSERNLKSSMPVRLRAMTWTGPGAPVAVTGMRSRVCRSVLEAHTAPLW